MRTSLPPKTGDSLQDAVNRAQWNLNSTHLANGRRYDAFLEAQNGRIVEAQAVLARAIARQRKAFK
jgi:hypothetical protein